MKKIIALFMTLCILCSMIPATYAMAAEPNEDKGTVLLSWQNLK